MSALPALKDVASTPDSLPRGLPPWTYSHAGMSRLEHERIFVPSWQIVCHVNSIPKPGDYLTMEIGPESVLVLRGRDGQIRAFHNVCRHRASRLLEGAGTCPGAITCPYHGWTYALDGSLRGVAQPASFPGLDRADYGLNPIRLEIAFSFVFVCIDGDPPPVAEMWGDFAEDFAPYRFGDLIPLGPTYTETWDVDWKVVMDNYLESYHVPIGHPGLNRMFTPDYEDQAVRPSGVARGVSWMRETRSQKWSEGKYQSLVESVTPHLPEASRRCWRFYSMLPNLGIDVYPDQMDIFQVLPRGPGKCTIRSAIFGPPDDRREMTLLRYLNNRINRAVMREDEFFCDRVQKGLFSRSYRPGPLSALETCMIQFHDLIRERIPEARSMVKPEELSG